MKPTWYHVLCAVDDIDDLSDIVAESNDAIAKGYALEFAALEDGKEIVVRTSKLQVRGRSAFAWGVKCDLRNTDTPG